MLNVTYKTSAYSNVITEGCDTYKMEVETPAEVIAARIAEEERINAKDKAALVALIGQERADRAEKHFGGDASRALKLAREQIAAGKCKAA